MLNVKTMDTETVDNQSFVEIVIPTENNILSFSELRNIVTELEFMPDGIGYHACKEHAESIEEGCI